MSVEENEVADRPCEDEDELLDGFTDESDLRDLSRRICVVTTAALPWRTGTAVNPLLRALYLTRGRPHQYVTLVIPWLKNDEESQNKLYGQVFAEKQEQEEWIRSYARERAKCSAEEAALKILFYDATYQNSFGSMFPVVDICNLVPDPDIAILEEPEHLNWFRVPSRSPLDAAKDFFRDVSSIAPSSEDGSQTASQHQGLFVGEQVHDNKDGADESLKLNLDQESDADVENKSESNQKSDLIKSDARAQQDIAELGWKYRFRHVVGILHTNYSAYMKQYGVGTSLIGAPAISILSSIVVKAYCHRVIRLSAVLPSLAPGKEVTENVHGVRVEFLESAAVSQGQEDEQAAIETATDDTRSTVYFIGKIIWAKGFDKLLKIQDLYHRSTGEYFQMDVYGSGSDEKAIKRAFFGRHGSPQDVRSEASDESEGIVSSDEPEATQDALAAAVFDTSLSLRERVYAAESDHVIQQSGFEVSISGPGDDSEERQTGPLSILGDFSGKSIGTALSTTQAVYKLADAAVCNGMSLALNWDDDGDAFELPQSLHEWRRIPIPARFLGVRDHAQLKTIPQQRVFLNPSITEVLCTTTAEALAMGKFAVIPKHASNEFFLQFRNCLAYETPEECVEKIQWALSHEPETLTAEEKRIFTWEAATERLYEASGITRREKKSRAENRGDKAGRMTLARLHVEFGKKGQFIGKLFSRDKSDKEEKTSNDVASTEED